MGVAPKTSSHGGEGGVDRYARNVDAPKQILKTDFENRF